MRRASPWTAGLVVALAASRAWATAPTASLALDQGLHAWAYCPARSLVAVSQGRQLLVGHVDVRERRLELLSKQPLETWAMEFSPDCALLVMSESSGDERHRVHGAAVWRVVGGKLTRLGRVDTFRYPVSGLASAKTAKLWQLDGTRATPAATLDGLVHVGKYVAVDGLRSVAADALIAGTGVSKATLEVYLPARGAR
jgi:hypothetical protein